VLDIARAARAKGPQSQERLKQGYERLLASTSRVVGQAMRFAREIADGVKRAPASLGSSPWKTCVSNSRTWRRGCGRR